MARIVIGILAADAVLLLSGFFVKSTSAPLIGSIVMSVAVTALIVVGLVRQFREQEGLASDEEPEIEELEDTDFAPADDDATITQTMPRAPVRRRVRPRIIPVDEPETKAAARKQPKPKPKQKPRAKPKAAPAKKPPAPRAKAAPRGGRVLVVPGASRYHRAGCRFVRGGNAREVSEATAISRGYERCGVCKP